MLLLAGLVPLIQMNQIDQIIGTDPIGLTKTFDIEALPRLQAKKREIVHPDQVVDDLAMTLPQGTDPF